jgi:serine/threonine protein kinase/tetratricopeptide (TPR) repeat protein
MAAELKRVKQIFLSALEKPNSAQRAEFLGQACGGDEELRRQVEALLSQHEQASGFLESPPAGLVPTADSGQLDREVTSLWRTVSSEIIGSRIGAFRLLQELGEGGMGAVYLAEQQQPVKRFVALKIIKAGMDSAHVIGRFEQERQALAMMDHPNIAKVLDAGATDAGRPYFVMELVKGIPITKYCDQENLTPRQRLELFIPVCQAVQHAHQKGVIHRDLKPSNVIIALYDGKPIPKVIDFGVAKATAQKLTERTMFTEVGQIVGTLEYMAPEQAELNNLDIDTRADVYSLGVILYELLTGSPPFTAKQLRSTAFTEMLRIIREVEPLRPSTKLSSSSELPAIAANRKLEPKKLTKLVHGDLDWIVMKCLEKERGRRYDTANGLAMDVERYLADEPVLAGPPSARYRLRKFVRRNGRGLATAVLLSVMLLAAVGVVAGTLGWASRDRAARRVIVAGKVQLALRDAQTLGDKALTLVDGNPYQWETTLAQALAAVHQADGLVESDESLDPGLLEQLAALKTRLVADESDRQFVTRFDDIRLNGFHLDIETSRFQNNEQPAMIKKLFKERGIDFQNTTPQQAAQRVRQCPAAIQQQMISALETWRFQTSSREDSQWLGSILEAAEFNPLRTKLFQAVAARDWKALERLAREPSINQQPTAFLLDFASGLPPELRATKLSLLREAQSAHPGDFWANFEYAVTLEDESQWEKAIGFYRAAIALRPRNPVAYMKLGSALYFNGNFDEAALAYQQAILLDPSLGFGHTGLGLTLNQKGDVDGALSEFRQGVDLSPGMPEGWYYLALGHLAAGQRDAYRRDCAEALTRFGKTQDPAIAARVLYACLPVPGALDDMTKLVPLAEVAATDKVNARVLGAALYRAGQFEAAIASLNEGQARAWDHLFLAMIHHRLGHKEQALEYAALADRQIKNEHYPWPENVESEQLRREAQDVLGIDPGKLLVDVGTVDIARWQAAVAANPKDAGAYYNLGNALGKKRDFKGAAAAYNKVVELTPQDAGAYHNLGIVLAETPDLDQAIGAYRKSIDLNPNDPRTFENLEIALTKKGEFAEAIAACHSAIELDSKDSWPRCRLAQLLANCRDPKQRDPIQALVHARKAVELAPNERNNWNTLGVAEFRAAHWKGAIAALEKSSELGQGGDGFDWFFLAMTHWQLGDKGKARQLYDRAVARMKKDPSSDEDISRLRLEAAALLMVEESSKPAPMAK